MWVRELCTPKWTDIAHNYVSINKSVKFNRVHKEYSDGNTMTKKVRA